MIVGSPFQETPVVTHVRQDDAGVSSSGDPGPAAGTAPLSRPAVAAHQLTIELVGSDHV